MLHSLISRIRRRPKHVREQYAFFGAVIFTGLVAFVWAVSLPSRFEVSAPTADVTEASRPFSAVLERARENLTSLGEAATQSSYTQTATTVPPTADPFSFITLTPEDLAAIEARRAGAAAGPNLAVPDAPAHRSILIATTTAPVAESPSME
jgi:hypothetical protein